MRTHGFGTRGLNKGITATLGRHGVFNMIYFGFYHNIRGMIPEAKVGMEFNIFLVTPASACFIILVSFLFVHHKL